MRYLDVPGPADGINVHLRSGEVSLIARALRCYMCSEQQAIQDALVNARTTKRAKDMLHAEDVRQHAQGHINAASALLDALGPRGRKSHGN